jgi:hypothetical protein
MPSPFLTEFAKEFGLDAAEMSLLSYADVRSAEDVHSLVYNFPSISRSGVRLNIVSNAVTQHLNLSYSTVANSVSVHPPSAPLGANLPPGSPITLGSAVGAPPSPPFAQPVVPTTTIDLRLGGLPWPVRNQDPRGTCVAFGATACVEHMQFQSEGANPDYSEEFLYWAIKDHSGDPDKTGDGTWLRFAREVLQSDGICHENLCPYVSSIVSPVSGPAPNAAATAEATTHKFTATTYQTRPSGAAAMVLQLLGNGRPVAICLPVFRDPMLPNGPNNWTTPIGWAYGRVLNPPPASLVCGGHCVCVTGFVPDSGEQRGGHFVVRNSWGSDWANLAPSPTSSNSPEQGYGEVSASYVDTFCSELLQL